MSRLASTTWLTCPACHQTTADAHYSIAGPHIKARCPTCGAHIKFVSKSIFTQGELAQLRPEKEVHDESDC